jgi:hypothetical protein
VPRRRPHSFRACLATLDMRVPRFHHPRHEETERVGEGKSIHPCQYKKSRRKLRAPSSATIPPPRTKTASSQTVISLALREVEGNGAVRRILFPTPFARHFERSRPTHSLRGPLCPSLRTDQSDAFSSRPLLPVISNVAVRRIFLSRSLLRTCRPAQREIPLRLAGTGSRKLLASSNSVGRGDDRGVRGVSECGSR